MSAYTNLMGVIDAGKNQYHKDGNEDAFTALLGQLSRSSVQMATEWARLAAMAEIGLG